MILPMKKKRMSKIYDPKNLLGKGQRFIEDEEKSKSRFEKTIAEKVKLSWQKAYNEDLSDMSLLQGDDSVEFIDIPDLAALEGEEVKEGKWLKILTPNKLLTRLPILLAQIKSRNNLYRLNMKQHKYWIFCISMIKLLRKFTTI